MKVKQILLAILFFFFVTPVYAQMSVGSGVYEFKGYQSKVGSPFNVYYYLPKGDASKMPILFVMHGVLRNADTYRDNWVDLAKKHKVIIVVPQFTQENFPRDRGYAFGNVQNSNGTLNDPSEWSFNLIDQIFDDVVKQTGSIQTSYDLFGHSAGSQFSHRFIIFSKANKANRVITANAGSYTVLDEDVKYPFGTKDMGIDNERLKMLLQKDLVVQLGDKDNDPNHKQLPKSAFAMKQGTNRFERGHYFYEKAKEQAQRLGVPFNWKLRIVQGAAHQNELMAIDAAKYLYGKK
jgi:hypothetical protein